MFGKMVAALGVLALVAALAAPAVAQEKELVWKTDGKRWWRTEELRLPVAMPETMMVAVPAGEQKEGDVLAFQYLGKRTERVYLREVCRAPEVVPAHECTWRMVYEKKEVNQRHFCLVNGMQKPCPGMTQGGACIGMK